MLKKFTPLAVLFAMFLFVACSTQKNTLVSRSYHSLISHYNIYFNGKESYKKGVSRVDDGYKNDYNQLLNVFTYIDKTLNATASSDMEIALKKASKVITFHSIKAKPVFKDNKLTPSQKEFMARNEYNAWVGNSYMLVAKANFYKGDFPQASKTISFVLREFPKDLVKYEALIWQARINIQSNQYTEADKILVNLQSDKKFPKRYLSDLNATHADLLIKREQYKNAVPKLEKALGTVYGKQTKLRYLYILAQLHQLLGEEDKAIELYKKLVKKNPPYEMAFNASINLASLIKVDSKSNKNIKSQLYKMLKDQKNKDFRDQIYYALANMEMREKNEDRAIELYKQSAVNTTNNDQQKATTYLTLADLYYSKKKYVPAQAYYDSSLQNLRDDYKDYDKIKSRATNLNKLVSNLNTIDLQDSLLHLSTLSKNDQITIVNSIIRDVQNKEAEEQQKKADEQSAGVINNRTLNTSNTGTGKWYFYNTVSVQQGITDFQARWGKRKLEDNWRRRNKGMNIAAAESPEMEVKAEQKQEKKVADNKKPEFYLQNIPVTEQDKQKANDQIQEAYFNAGGTYRDDLNEPDEAIKLYEELVKRYPNGNLAASASFQIYSTSNSVGNTAKATQYKQLILSRYPESIYAKVLSNPDYAKKASEEENRINNLYEETYHLYNSGNYAQAIANSDQALKEVKNKDLASRFAFIRALSLGKTSDPTNFRRELDKVITSYPNSEVSVAAKDIIQKIDTYNPEVQKTEETIKAEATYSQEDKAPILVAWFVSTVEDVNQLVFDIINFNLDNFNKQKFEIQNAEFNKEYKIITVHQFNSRKDAIAYYTVFGQSPAISRNLKDKRARVFVITEDNLKVLQADKNVDTYQRFFDKYYLNK